MQASKENSQTGVPRQRDKSEPQKNASQQGKLTSWSAQTERQVRTQKECKIARGTYILERPDRETSQDTKGMQDSKGNLHSEEARQRDKSGH
jgi:hypothetical protein